jgi:hypothetical protein
MLETAKLRGPFEKFVDSPYYSESELCGDVVTVSFSKYLPWQAMHFLQRSTQLLEDVLQTVCRKLQEDSGTGCSESTNFSNCPCSFSAILKRVILKRP